MGEWFTFDRHLIIKVIPQMVDYFSNIEIMIKVVTNLQLEKITI